MRNRYCRHCNERLVDHAIGWAAYGKLTKHASYGDPYDCTKSPTNKHEPRP